MSGAGARRPRLPLLSSLSTPIRHLAFPVLRTTTTWSASTSRAWRPASAPRSALFIPCGHTHGGPPRSYSRSGDIPRFPTTTGHFQPDCAHHGPRHLPRAAVAAAAGLCGQRLFPHHQQLLLPDSPGALLAQRCSLLPRQPCCCRRPTRFPTAAIVPIPARSKPTGASLTSRRFSAALRTLSPRSPNTWRTCPTASLTTTVAH